MIDRMIADAQPPAEPDLGWAAQAILSRGSGFYSEESRNIAAEWIADAFMGLPGDSRARGEVWRHLAIVAERDRKTQSEFLRELVLAATDAAAQRTRDLPARRDTPGKRIELANGLLADVRRSLKKLLPLDLDELPDLGEPDSELLLILGSPLSPREDDLVAALKENDYVIADAARQLGIEPGTARGMLSSIRKKIS